MRFGSNGYGSFIDDDRFEERGLLFGNLDNMLAYNREQVVGKESNQDSLFGGLSDVDNLTLFPCDKATMTEKLLWEKELP